MDKVRFKRDDAGVGAILSEVAQGDCLEIAKDIAAKASAQSGGLYGVDVKTGKHNGKVFQQQYPTVRTIDWTAYMDNLRNNTLLKLVR